LVQPIIIWFADLHEAAGTLRHPPHSPSNQPRRFLAAVGNVIRYPQLLQATVFSDSTFLFSQYPLSKFFASDRKRGQPCSNRAAANALRVRENLIQKIGCRFLLNRI
jgi:hypothetical protein